MLKHLLSRNNTQQPFWYQVSPQGGPIIRKKVLTFFCCESCQKSLCPKYSFYFNVKLIFPLQSIHSANPADISISTIFIRKGCAMYTGKIDMKTERVIHLSGGLDIHTIHIRVSHTQVYHKSHCHVIRPFLSKNTRYDLIFHWNLIMIYLDT